jgi:hypothetical protein
MAFIEKSDPVVLNIKLTTKGRELLSTGNLSFKYFAIGDSEIDYKFDNAVGLNPFYANILRPADNNPNIISFIPQTLSGDPYNVIPSIPTSTYLVTNNAGSIGFFSNLSGNSFTFNTDPDHVKQAGIMIYMSSITGGSTLYLKQASNYIPLNEPSKGDLILVKWTINGDTTPFLTDTTKPTPFLIYRIINIISGSLGANNLVVSVDRKLPNFTGLNATGIAGAVIYYYSENITGNTINGMSSTDYIAESVLTFQQNSQCPTEIFPFWNMSIIFTDEIAGVQSSLNNKTYAEFKTKGYGGFVSYIQSQQPYYKKLGVIHYSNNSPANVYAEGFYLNTAVLDMPTIMWHKNSTPKLGAKFIAAIGNGYTLATLGIHYYDLVDASNPTAVVGKIFDELKMFLIEDQELLYAMSYKSNRSWTLPQFSLAGGSGGNSPVPPAPQILFVQTQIGTPGSIKNTGGKNIIGWENVTEYGVEYKLTGATDWTRIKVGITLGANNFDYTITNTTPNKSYNYRAYVMIGNNSYVDHSNDNNPITTLPAPPTPPPTPPVIIPSVTTIKGTSGIGQINGTGGNSIPANVFVAIEKYGMEYKESSLADVPANWHLSPAIALSGPLSVGNFILDITGLAQSTSYDYRAYIQVAGIKYISGSWQTDITTATPPPTTYAPQVTTGSIFKQLTYNGAIDALTKLNQIVDKGGLPLTEYGLLYTQDLANYDPAKLIYGGVGIGKASLVQDYPNPTGAFAITMSGLLDSSAIYFRAFAQNGSGIGYGDIVYDETNPLAVVPPSNTVYICGATQLGSNPAVTSCMAGKLGVSTPLGAGESIILHFTNCAISDTVTAGNQALLANIRASAYYTVGAGTTQNILACSIMPFDTEDTCNNQASGTLTITASNIDNICLHSNAYSASKNTSYSYTNLSSVNITEIENVGGANYQLGANSMEAYNISGSGAPVGHGSLPVAAL